MGFSLWINLWKPPWMQGQVQEGHPATIDLPDSPSWNGRDRVRDIMDWIQSIMDGYPDETWVVSLSYGFAKHQTRIVVSSTTRRFDYFGPIKLADIWKIEARFVKKQLPKVA